MRLWSIHPRYLDPAGLVAVWREGLLAQAVLGGLTRGYRNHPQLIRFRAQKNARIAIATYLHAIVDEADARGYKFDRRKIVTRRRVTLIQVEDGQLAYEWKHLKAKLRERNPEWYRKVRVIALAEAHPCFAIVKGGVAEWERVLSSPAHVANRPQGRKLRDHQLRAADVPRVRRRRMGSGEGVPQVRSR